jgi:hypothetical protein
LPNGTEASQIPAEIDRIVARHPAVDGARESRKTPPRDAVGTGELVVNLVTGDLIEPLYKRSAEHPRKTSEAELLGPALEPGLAVQTPRWRSPWPRS